jgi:hypothetical protein
MRIIRETICVVFLLLLMACALTVQAQVQATNGRIQGDVTDASGAAVDNAKVEATEIETGVAQDSVTDRSGHFEFPSLKPGRYTVKVSKTGFASTIQENLTLTVGLTASLKLTLQVAGTTESVVVTDAPLTDVTQTASTTTLDESSRLRRRRYLGASSRIC